MFELRIGTVAEKSLEKGMGGLEWSSSVINSVAWPIAAVVIGLIFRSQISDLLKKVRKLSWGDKVADFAETLDKIETTNQQEAPPNGEDAQADNSMPDIRFQKLLEISPSAAILDAWKPIELRLIELGRRPVPQSDPRTRVRSPRQAMDWLLDTGEITPWLHENLTALQKIRNAAAHNEEVSTIDAYRFRDFAKKSMAELGKIMPR